MKGIFTNEQKHNQSMFRRLCKTYYLKPPKHFHDEGLFFFLQHLVYIAKYF